jgi:glucose 1-dehydrogenase
MANDKDWLGLAGKVAAVTGAASGVGKAVAAEFAAVGCKVVALDVNQANLDGVVGELKGKGADVIGVQCDVTSDASVQAAAKAAEDAFGGTDVLCNNAGILRPGELTDLSIADWDAMMNVNLTGYLRCSQAFGKSMIAKGSGALVHIASIAASQPQAASGAYSPGKAAVVMLSRQLAFEWAPKGVRSNVVSPGLVRTALSEAFYQAPGVQQGRAVGAHRAHRGHRRCGRVLRVRPGELRHGPGSRRRWRLCADPDESRAAAGVLRAGGLAGAANRSGNEDLAELSPRKMRSIYPGSLASAMARLQGAALNPERSRLSARALSGNAKRGFG